jgi:hypothetical protein
MDTCICCGLTRDEVEDNFGEMLRIGKVDICKYCYDDFVEDVFWYNAPNEEDTFIERRLRNYFGE